MLVVLLSLFFVIAVALGETATSIADLCPADLSKYRSSKVISSFDPLKLEGMWYEIAYHDAAQVKETCQSYSRTITKSETTDGAFHMQEAFGFTYADHSPEPHALKLAADFHVPDTERGLYERYMDMPLVNRLKFPSVVVDFTTTRTGEYDTVSEFLCYNVGKIPYREIRIGSRSPTMSDAQLLILEQNLKSLGVPFEMLRRANQTGCSYVK
jgi:hypothetical protein